MHMYYGLACSILFQRSRHTRTHARTHTHTHTHTNAYKSTHPHTCTHTTHTHVQTQSIMHVTNNRFNVISTFKSYSVKKT